MAKLDRKHRLGRRFDDALVHALRLHRKQKRKGKDVPYAAHLLGTAGIVLHFEGDEAQAMAALLHDAAEDCGGRPRLAKIRERFGRDVARMVEDCTDTFEKVKPPWKARKEAYLAALPRKGTRSQLVSAADKLDNARAIVADLRVDGPDTLERFSGKQETVWYFRELVRIFARSKVGPIAGELAAAVREMEALATLAVAGAPSLTGPGREPTKRPVRRRPGGR
jgi:(p)ppGpp synthase/HD superfamily hydrolase